MTYITTKHDLNRIFKVEKKTFEYASEEEWLNHALESSRVDPNAEYREPEYDPKKIFCNTVYHIREGKERTGRVILDITGLARYSNSEIRDIIEDAFRKNKPEPLSR